MLSCFIDLINLRQTKAPVSPGLIAHRLLLITSKHCYVLVLTVLVACLFLFTKYECLVEAELFEFSLVEVCHTIPWIAVKF